MGTSEKLLYEAQVDENTGLQLKKIYMDGIPLLKLLVIDDRVGNRHIMDGPRAWELAKVLAEAGLMVGEELTQMRKAADEQLAATKRLN